MIRIAAPHDRWRASRIPMAPASEGESRETISAADRVEILVLVDNVTDNLSSVPGEVENEWPRLWKRGMRQLSGNCLCCGAHGLSCAITAWRGDMSHTLLFDTGPEASVFERNVERLGFDMGTVEGIVLSHGHWDHCGAMLRALDMIRARNGGRRGTDLHAPRHVPKPRGQGQGWGHAPHGGRPERCRCSRSTAPASCIRARRS